MNLYSAHLHLQQQLWQRVFAQIPFDAAIISAGRSRPYLFDDQHPTFHANPHFLRWVPFTEAQGSTLIISAEGKPILHFLQEADYWHRPPTLPEWIANSLQVVVHRDPERLQARVRQTIEKRAVAYIGDATDNDWQDDSINNPDALLHPIDFARAYKTDFELDCLRKAADRAVAGHRAAAAAFEAHASEFEIHLAYLRASEQTEADLPYPNIIALNENAGVLHYQHQERDHPSEYRSFLIDAGGRELGYAADITRSYASRHASEFQALVSAMDQLQQQMLQAIRIGEEFDALHNHAHLLLAQLLLDQQLATGSPESLVSNGITRAFLPHGLGHLIGLQTHDVAGHMRSADGMLRQPEPQYSALRLTRPMEPGMVFTIEPGLYFISQLLEQLRAMPAGKAVNWPRVERLMIYGGIRIEDNVHITDQGIENLTRDAFARHS